MELAFCSSRLLPFLSALLNREIELGRMGRSTRQGNTQGPLQLRAREKCVACDARRAGCRSSRGEVPMLRELVPAVVIPLLVLLLAMLALEQ